MIHRRAVTVLVAALLAGTAAPAHATFPGVNGSIAYQGFDPGFTIEAVTPDGAFQRRLTSPGANPAWSPNGSLLAFSAQLAGVQVYTMAQDGSGVSQLTRLADPWTPTWSPDGRHLAVADFNPNYDIWTVDADGSNARQLTSSPAEDIHPSWSPDGSRIAFQTDRDGDHEIYVVNADGTGLQDLTRAHATEEFGPDWSPDGSEIVFTRSGAGQSGIWAVKTDGSGAARLIGQGADPGWSPDGQRIVFVRNVLGFTDLYSMRRDGTDVERITTDGREKVLPAWQPLAGDTVSHTAVTALPATITYGESASFTSRVTGASVPSGLVRFQVDGTNAGSPTPIGTDGRNTFSPSRPLDVGDVVSAGYGGDAKLGWSSGAASLTIAPAATALQLAIAPNPVTRGATAAVTVTVANQATGIVPFGSVTFTAGGIPLGTIDLDDSGRAIAVLATTVPAGEYRIQARYEDDTADIPDFEPSDGALTVRVVDPPTPEPPKRIVLAPPPAVTLSDVTAFAKRLEQALRSRGFAALHGTGPRFVAAAPGTLSQQLYTAASSRGRRVLVSSGRRTIRTAGAAAKMTLRLTPVGRRLVRRAKRLTLVAVTRFAPQSGAPMQVSRRVVVRRSASGRG